MMVWQVNASEAAEKRGAKAKQKRVMSNDDSNNVTCGSRDNKANEGGRRTEGGGI
jgi:hypothetical protein